MEILASVKLFKYSKIPSPLNKLGSSHTGMLVLSFQCNLALFGIRISLPVSLAILKDTVGN